MKTIDVNNKEETNSLTGQTQHLLIKLASAQRKPGFVTDDVIKAHNTIVNQHGTVWFGKSGRPLNQSHVDLFNTSIKQNKQSQLVLFRRNGSEYDYFGAKIYTVHSGKFRPPIEQVPEYYRGMTQNISTWVEIGLFSKMQQRKLGKLVVASSQRSVIEVVPICQQSTMIVCEKS